MLASERSTCPRMHCGCVIVKDKFVLATGYNGSLPGLPHCEDEGCLIVDNHCVRTNHAEINALTQAVTHGVNIKGSTAYITNMSCTTCAKALIAAGIKRVVVFSDYHDTLATKFYSDSKVDIVKLNMPEKEIHYDLKGYSSARKTKKSK
jgi:dCMP deaminase